MFSSVLSLLDTDYLSQNGSEGVYRWVDASCLCDEISFTHSILQMYDDAMNGVAEHLIHKTPRAHLTYTSELIPQRTRTGEM